MQSVDFYQQHLNEVSRSFAFCIERLDDPFRRWVSLSYLLCRVADTVEDSAWTSPEAQREHFLRFRNFVRKLPTPQEVKAWAEGFPEMPAGERALLDVSHSLFEDLHQLPARVRECIQSCVQRMSRGMAHFARNRPGFRLLNQREINQYCMFVAGLVGELLTSLLRAHANGAPKNKMIYRYAYHFGLFLQKINLLKDQRADASSGRFFVRDRGSLMTSLKKNAVYAFEYLLALPKAEKGFRVFCAWSLFLGLASLPWIQQSAISTEDVKIPRDQTKLILGHIEQLIEEDELLRKEFESFLSFLPGDPALKVSVEDALLSDTKMDYYFGRALTRQDLQDLEV